METPGRRVKAIEDVKEPGDYALVPSYGPEGLRPGHMELWFVLPESRDPALTTRGRRFIPSDAGWTFSDNSDGTVTVTPSIWAHIGQRDGTTRPGWHGFLERGVWREV